MSVKCHTVGPAEGHKHTHTVIFLHGRDSVAEEFADEFFESEASGPETGDRILLGLFPTIRWVFPTAPLMHSERFGTTMSQWFDMWSVEDPEEKSELQKPGLLQSIRIVLNTIRSEEALAPRNRIFLGGISQGFATALSAFCVGGGGLAGLIGLCGWMPYVSSFEKAAAQGSFKQVIRQTQGMLPGENFDDISTAPIQATPLMIGHAADDDVVPVENGRRMRDMLLLLGFGVYWHEYEDGGHWVNEPRGVDDICRFLRAVMGQEEA
ncbi:hypothetical protein DL768_001587 [Monosporascus sp. mg162]|nr:hypothetical protein DL768_001587 [Monosporascus sp. mg162]